MKDLKLKKTEHSYYCNESNYYSNDAYMSYECWNDFVRAWEPIKMDIDMNYIFRFDIKKYEEEDGEEEPFTLQLFIMHQRKGNFRCVEITNINNENMKEITELLKMHYEYHGELWKEFSV